ncbi:patatin-like phospholipase family protein [Tahibacter soli]|jgi:NTE family protein|uniref:Patatin-like phospholipase family protein n=1 Tax=Tahibacter soli TaxID=2983605 RepID=A0A9X3YFS5_9GAMM|nr:patatin-like phospholipase family protein [Tahibacter soli]MDC8011181.1 patatin-like phospholipase family protein [Tahibacter soli]
MRLSLRLLAFLTLVSCIAAPAAARTCLVLGGGGARGAAHIGVLKVLERERVPIDCITGTSMGAIVGGLYAAGYDADAIEVVLKGIDWKDMFRDDPPRQELPMRRKEDELRFLGGIELGLKDGSIALPRGMIQGQKLQLLLRRLLLSTGGVQTFDDLPIPFRSIATDIGNGEKVVFSDGDLAMAIRASMSVPGAFAPVRYRGRLMVDGGIVDNVPIDVARALGGTRLIVVNVGEPLVDEEKLNSPFSIANQMLTTLMKRETDIQLATLGDADVLIVPDLGDVGSADFQRAGETVAAGAASAEKAVVALRRYAVDEARYAQFTARHRQRGFDPPLIAFIDVLRGRSRTAAYVEQRLSDNVDKPFDPKTLESDIGLAYGEGSYERITYELAERDGKTGLEVHPVDKGWGPNFLRFGLRLSDDFAGRNSYQLIGEMNFTGLNERGGESRNRLELGRVTGLHSEFYQPFGDHGQYYVAPYLDYRANNIPIGSGIDLNETLAEYRRSRSIAALELGYTPDATWRFSGTIEYGYDSVKRRVGTPDLPASLDQTFGGVKLQVTRDSLDDSGFPTRGSRLDLSDELLLTELGSESAANVVRLNWDTAFSYGANRWLVGTRLHSAGGDGDLLSTFGTLGGLANLSGFTENQLLAGQTALGRVVYYRRLTDATKLISVPVYAGASLEAGGIWDTRDEVRGKDLVGAGSLFLGIDTFLGPVFVGYGHAQGGHNSFYLTFGSLLRPND